MVLKSIWKAERTLGKRLHEYYIERDIRKIMILKKHNVITRPGQYLKKMMMKYPYHEVESRKRIIFFAKEEYRDTFKSNMEVNEYGEKDYTDGLLGEYLMYPPTAVDWYVANQERILEEPGEVVNVHYKGIPFVTHKDLVRENISWMDQNVRVPKELGLGISVLEREVKLNQYKYKNRG